MVVLLLLLFNAAVFMFLLFASDIWKLLLLMQGLEKLFLKVTVLLGNKNIDKERGSKYDTKMVMLLMLLFSATVLLLSSNGDKLYFLRH